VLLLLLGTEWSVFESQAEMQHLHDWNAGYFSGFQLVKSHLIVVEPVNQKRVTVLHYFIVLMNDESEARYLNELTNLKMAVLTA
jgi:hypothetical protein